MVKLLVVGGESVGKTSLVQRYADAPFDHKYTPTLGADLSVVFYGALPSAREVRVQFCDFSHRELLEGRTSHLAHALSGVSAILIVFDVCNMDSFSAVDSWRSLLMRYVSPETIPFCLMANKCDLLDLKTARADGLRRALDAYSRDAGCTSWNWTSARTGTTAKEAINGVVQEVLQRYNRLRVAAMSSGKFSQSEKFPQ